jgi:hypothetical protein
LPPSRRTIVPGSVGKLGLGETSKDAVAAQARNEHRLTALLFLL